MAFSLNKKSIIFKDQEAILLIIREYSLVEKIQRRVSENKYREVLLSTVSHDIKTPLTIIEGNMTLLSDFIKEEGMEYYKAVYTATEMLDFFFQDLHVKYIKEFS